MKRLGVRRIEHSGLFQHGHGRLGPLLPNKARAQEEEVLGLLLVVTEATE